MGQLLGRSWVERIWIVEEVAVGKTVGILYHGTCTEWDVLAAVIKRLSTDSDFERQLQYHNSPNVTSPNTSDRRLG
jgi:hypothetical protein